MTPELCACCSHMVAPRELITRCPVPVGWLESWLCFPASQQGVDGQLSIAFGIMPHHAM